MKKASIWTGLKIAAITSTVGKVNKPWAARYLVNSLSEFPGLPSKAVQIFSSHIGAEAQPPAQNTYALSLEEVKSILDAEVPHLVEASDEIDPAFANASLGQVHRLKSKIGEFLIVKVLYPGIEKEMISQLDLLLKLGKMGPLKKYGLNLASYRSFFSEKFSDEVDYEKEAHTQSQLYTAFHDLLYVVVPKVFTQYSTKKVLTQSFEESENLAALTLCSQQQREACANHLIHFFIYSLFKTGWIHADLHPENWGYRPLLSQLVLYDFGSTLKITQVQKNALIALIDALPSDDFQPYLSALTDLGFDAEKLERIQTRLPNLCRKLCGSLLRSKFSKTTFESQEFDELLDSDKWYFRVAGPPWFLQLMKSVKFILEAVSKLEVSVDLKKQIEDVLERPLLLYETNQCQIPPAQEFQRAKSLFVSVHENAQELVLVELPVTAIDDLESLIPEDTYTRLVAKGHDFKSDTEKVQASGYKAQIVFEAHDEVKNRCYKIWIQ